MANNYTKILELANKNNMGLSNTIKRDYGIPLDYSSVQETYEAALAYAQTSTLAYIGQPISVGDTLYIVTGEAGDAALKAVGTKPVGDTTSIEVTNEGVVSIKGFKAAGTSTLPRKKSDGSIEWVTVDQIVQGDGNTKAVVKAADDSDITVTSAHDENTDTYTYTLDVQFPAIPAYSVSKTVDTGAKTTTYKLTKDGNAEGEAIVVPDAYDDSALDSRLTAAESDIEDHEGRIAGIEAFFEGATADEGEGESLKNALDTLKEIQEYVTADGEVAKTVTSNASTLATLTGSDTTTGSIAKTVKDAIAAQATVDDGKYATQSALEAVESVANAAAVKTEVDTALAGKVDNATLNNYYTKDVTYTKTEVEGLIDSITGTGAGSLSNQLATHITESGSKFTALESEDERLASLIKDNADAIDAINDDATGIYASAVSAATTAAAADAKAKVEALENTKVNTNAAAIESINSQIEGINTNYGTLSGKVGTLEQAKTDMAASISALEGTHSTLSGTVAGHTTDITGLKSKDTELAAAIEANTAKFDEYSNTTAVKALIKDAVDGVSTNGVAANTKAIEDEVTRAKAEEERLAGLIGANDTAIKVNASSITALEATLNAAIENEDGTALDSIKELATWIAEHDDPENGILKTVNDNKTAIATLNGTGTGSVKKTVDDAIAAIPVATTTKAGIVKASSDIAVAADGVMSINEGVFNTDRLVQGVNTLILNGGTANVTPVTGT